MIDHGCIQRQSWDFRGSAVHTRGMRCILITGEASFAQIMAWAAFLLHQELSVLSLTFVSSCKRYTWASEVLATHRRVFLGNQLQTTQGTANDEAWWAVVYRECFEREWRGSLALDTSSVSTLPFLSLPTKMFTDQQGGVSTPNILEEATALLGLYSDCFLRSAFFQRRKKLYRDSQMELGVLTALVCLSWPCV